MASHERSVPKIPPPAHDANGGDGEPSPPPIVRDAGLARIIDEYIQSKQTPGTRKMYGFALDDYLAFAGTSTERELLAQEVADIVRYRNHLQDRGLAAPTINMRLAAVRGLYWRLLKERKIEHNPADRELVEGLKTSDVSRTEGLTLDEVQRMLASCDGTLGGLRDRALLVTLYYEGLRRSEASRLDYRDISSRSGMLEVRNSKNSPYNTVRLRPTAKAVIEDYLEVLNRELRRSETRAEDPVFVSLSRLRTFGGRLSPSAINEIVKLRAKAARIERRITAHSMRHTCTTHALAGGAPLHQVQRHLRHKDVKTTLRYDREREARKNPTTDALPDVG